METGKVSQIDPDKLIVMGKARPELFDISLKDYHNIEKINKPWEEIGMEMNSTAIRCKMKWHALRSSYTRYLRDIRKSGAKKKKRHFADAMGFLENNLGPFKKVSRNLDIHSREEPLVIMDLPDEPIIFNPENTEQYDNFSSSEIAGAVRVDCSVAEISQLEKRQKHIVTEIVTEPMSDYSKSEMLKTYRSEDDPMINFFKSLLPDLSKLDDRRKRKFKAKVLQVVDELIDEQELAVLSQPVFVVSHPPSNSNNSLHKHETNSGPSHNSCSNYKQHLPQGDLPSITDLNHNS